MNMKKTKNTVPVDPTTSVGTQLGAIASNLASTTTLSAKQRDLLGSRSRRVPDALIELVLKLADTNGGQVAGTPIDVTAMRAALTQVSEASEAAADSRRIAAQLSDEALSQRIVVADRIFGIYASLRRLVNTPEGAPLARAYEEMASVLRNQPRRKRAQAAADATSPSQPEPSASAPSQPAPKPVVTAPAATAPAATPSAS